MCIVMPVLDEAEGIASHLLALAPLRQRGVRVVVVDGGSRDATVARATPLADAVVPAPRGRGRQLAAGVAACPARVYLFLHADTRLPPQADQLVLAACTHPAAWGRFDVRLDSPRPLLRLVGRMISWRSRLSGLATGDQAMFMHHRALAAVGGVPDLPLMEDLTLSRALRARSRPVSLRASVRTSARRWETRGAWRTILLMWRLRAAWACGADPEVLARRYGYRPRQDDAPPA